MKFSCGCEYDEFDYETMPMDCEATWKVVSDGFTKGVFQLEKTLGKRWAKKVSPRDIEELSDVISLIRPGPLMAEYREDPNNPGKMLSIADTYVAVKNGDIQPEYIHPVFESIFKDTYSVPIYQEQIMEICTEFAGFTLLEADDARKAVGKKLPEVMQKVKDKFLSGAQKMGHDKELAEEVFSWIDEFSGYGFNKSHGVGYAMLGYYTAYCKVHFPIFFFKHMLANSDAKVDEYEEVKELVNEAKVASMWSGDNIRIVPPSLKHGNPEFITRGDDEIVFGLSYIKGVGKSAISKLKKLPDINNWPQFVEYIFKNKAANKTTIENLIKVGALDFLSSKRIDMLKQYKMLYFMTERERNEVFKLFDFASIHNLVSGTTCDTSVVHNAIVTVMNSDIPRATRKPKLKNAFQEIAQELGGNPKKMSIAYEKHLLGTPLTGSEVELYNNRQVDTTCRDFLRLRNKSYCAIGVVIEDIRKIKDRRGNMMCFLKVSDNTYMLDGVVVFSRHFANYSWILELGKPVLIKGKKDDDSLLVNSIEHL